MFAKITEIFNKLKDIIYNFINILRNHSKKINIDTTYFSNMNYGIICICVIVFLALYYPLGALLTEKIERNTDIDVVTSNNKQSHTLNMISHLINQEVNENIWTPNLPFFFPASILDNMPNYQLGMINGISKFTSSFEKRIDKNFPNKENNSDLYKASTMLRYPGTIWMFDPNNKIKPVPSASSKYRKARRRINKYNQALALEQINFDKNIDDLIYILKSSNKNLSQTTNQLSAHIRENNSSFIDFKADDVFYYNQGKIYAYYMLLKNLGLDYQDIIVQNNLYQQWISLNKSLQNACLVQPKIIRNANLNSSISPNHLMYLKSYTLKAQNIIQKLINSLEQ